jgi:hypothetical protein
MDLPTEASNLLARDKLDDFVSLLLNPFAQSASAQLHVSATDLSNKVSCRLRGRLSGLRWALQSVALP